MKKYKITVDGTIYEVEVEELSVADEGRQQLLRPSGGSDADDTGCNQAGSRGKTPGRQNPPAPSTGAGQPSAGTAVRAPMPGTILSVEVTAGQHVNAGDVLVILEAMKMENEILAAAAGRVISLSAVKGASVNTGDVLAVIG